MRVLQPCERSVVTLMGSNVTLAEEMSLNRSLSPLKTSKLHPPEPHQVGPSRSTTASLSPSLFRSASAFYYQP